MKIKYTEYVPNPALRGTIAHLPQHRAQPLIDQGVAIEIPYSSYLERLTAEEAERQRFLPQATAKVTWAVGKGERNGRVFISAQCSSSQCGSAFFFDGAPAAADKLIFTHSCSGTAPEKVPTAVAEKYRKLHFVPAVLGADEASYHFAARPQPSQVADLSHLKGPLPGVAVNHKHDNYGISNFSPDPSDGKPVDHSKLKTQFALGKK